MTSQVSFDFSGRMVIVTGAARGVGHAMVGAFFESGASVIAADRDESGLIETCRPYAERVTAVVADVSAPEGANTITKEGHGNWNAFAAVGRVLRRVCSRQTEHSRFGRHRYG